MLAALIFCLGARKDLNSLEEKNKKSPNKLNLIKGLLVI